MWRAREKSGLKETVDGDLPGPKKLRGCIAASPIAPTICEEAYLFFFFFAFAFFFAAILFSSPLYQILASEAGGARNPSPCIRTVQNLVKWKVINGCENFLAVSYK